MYTDWSEIASKRKWNAAKCWGETMDKLEPLSVEPEIISEEQKRSRHSKIAKQAAAALLAKNPNYFKEIAKKSAATLLARNPNHFKELSAKAHQKRKIIAGL